MMSWDRIRFVGAAAPIFALIGAGLTGGPARLAGQVPARTARTVAMYERASRVEALQIPRVLETLGVASGMTVADVGAGSGLFTRPLARSVGEDGAVYAVDIDPGMLAHIDASVAEQGIRNVHTVLAEPTDPGLPDAVDLVFMCDMLHQVPDKAGYLETLGRYLRVAGRVAVVDLVGNWPARPDMHYSKEDLEGMMAALGYAKVGDYEFIPAHFFVVFQKPQGGR